MIVCIPTEQDLGIESIAYSHFGSASCYLLVNTETGETETVNNEDAHHAHGTCQPLQALGDKTVDAVLVGGIGRRALAGLNASGIKVFQSEELTVRELIEKIKTGALCELTPDQACNGHHGGCH